ncbi:hypothetical protein MAR_036238 [Mya arenaria]|uniref:Uncharacterized protein n=1 Tax=Mya arenaria TaxID=6604 RepID=A0ABY7EQ01_MYAAR|nr:hypothetical protein MAR_036238 [Mya arenaria]
MACSGEEGEQNHAKLIQLEKPVQNMLKALLENETTKQATTIDQLLFNHRKSFRRIGKSAQHLLFPQGNQPPNLEAWDLSLFCNVLRNCFLMQTTQENDVNAVRTTRNDIHHLAKPFISNADYTKYAHVYKSFITNTLNYKNDQNLKAVINEQVQEAERPVTKQAIELCQFFHKSYFSNADDVNGINENIDEKHDILFEELQDMKRIISTLPKESQLKLKPPAELIDAEYGCVCIFTRFYDFLSYMDFLDDLVNGKLTKIALPLQNALRCCFGIEDLQVELVMEDEQFLQCFKNTLECVKNVYPLLKKTTRESDQDAPVADVPDIIMSTFYTELDNNIDLTLSKNDANKYGMVLKDAIELFIAGQSQRQAPAVRAEREVKRLTKESIKTEEESISPTGKDQVQSYPGEARAVRLTKQDAESVDELMLQKGTDHVLSPALEKGEAAEGHFKQESTQSFDKDLLPKDSKILPRIDLKLLSLRKADVFRSTKQNEESETLLQKSNDPPSDQDQLLPVEAEEVDSTCGVYVSLPIEAEEEIIRTTKQSFESVDEALLPLGLCLDEVSKGSVIFKCKPTRPNALETLTSFCNSGRIKAVISAFFSVPSALENLPQAGFVQRLTIDAAFVDYENERNLQDVTLKFQRYSENDTEKEQKDPKIKSRMSDKTLRSTELIYQGIVRFTIEDKVTEISSCVQPDVVNKDISKRQDFEMQELFHRKRPVTEISSCVQPDVVNKDISKRQGNIVKAVLFRILFYISPTYYGKWHTNNISHSIEDVR